MQNFLINISSFSIFPYYYYFRITPYEIIYQELISNESDNGEFSPPLYNESMSKKSKLNMVQCKNVDT